MIELPSCDKRVSESWGWGDPIHVDPWKVVAIEPKRHSYHSFRPHQDYCTVHLDTGAAFDVLMDAKDVRRKVDEGKLPVEGPPEQIGTGLYRMADGEIAGNDPEPEQR